MSYWGSTGGVDGKALTFFLRDMDSVLNPPITPPGLPPPSHQDLLPETTEEGEGAVDRVYTLPYNY